jgi:hypothetical protein
MEGIPITSPDIDTLLTDLKNTIDQLHSNFGTVRDQILELARVLDESKRCERGHISRKIKDLLKEEIKAGKISSKWIHDCLPLEYKRPYNKRELSSLSGSIESSNGRSSSPSQVLEANTDQPGGNHSFDDAESAAPSEGQSFLERQEQDNKQSDESIQHDDSSQLPKNHTEYEDIIKHLKGDLAIKINLIADLHAEIEHLRDQLKATVEKTNGFDAIRSEGSKMEPRDVVSVEFLVPFEKMRSSLDALHARKNDIKMVAFHAKINSRSGKLIALTLRNFSPRERLVT